MPEVLDPPAKRPRQKRINRGLAGALAATTELTWDEIAEKVGAKNGNSLKVCMFSQGVTKASVKPEATEPVRATLVAKVVTEATEVLREQANGVLALQLGKLAAKKPGKLASKGQGEAAVLKTMAETWRCLNGNPDSITVQFGVGRMDPSQMIASQTPPQVVSGVPAVDVEATSTPQV